MVPSCDNARLPLSLLVDDELPISRLKPVVASSSSLSPEVKVYSEESFSSIMTFNQVSSRAVTFNNNFSETTLADLVSEPTT